MSHMITKRTYEFKETLKIATSIHIKILHLIHKILKKQESSPILFPHKNQSTIMEMGSNGA